MLTSLVTASCSDKNQAEAPEVSIAVVAPAHFHASLIQKSEIESVDSCVRVYAPDTAGIEQYLEAIGAYNSREDNPTHWRTEIHTGADFLEQLREDSISNIVVLAGNNRHKTRYIAAAIEAGKNVLADKPLAINGEDYALLGRALALAEEKGLIIRELMTERFDTLNIVTRRLLNDTVRFGTLVKGSPAAPAISMESNHHFFKNVSGKPLIRPQWYYDVTQQGEGIADVTTHLIDLIMWQAFPDSETGPDAVTVNSASHYPTLISPEQYARSTGYAGGGFPDFLSGAVRDGMLEVFANGSIDFDINGTNMRIDVRWDYEAPEGSGDTFTACYRGTKGTVEIIQDASTGYVKTLYYTPAGSSERLLIDIPAEERLGHEDHFNRLTADFLRQFSHAQMADRENLNTLAKYFIATTAVEMAGKSK